HARRAARVPDRQLALQDVEHLVHVVLVRLVREVGRVFDAGQGRPVLLVAQVARPRPIPPAAAVRYAVQGAVENPSHVKSFEAPALTPAPRGYPPLPKLGEGELWSSAPAQPTTADSSTAPAVSSPSPNL